MKKLSLVILMILLMGSAYALSITPGRSSINYEAGIEKEIEFSVINNEHKEMQVVFSVQGELNGSVSLYTKTVDFAANEESKSFKYKVSLPESLTKKPGLHFAEIVAMEIPKSSDSGTYVGATVAVVSQLFVYVQCPGKCIESDLNAIDGEEGVNFVIPVVNRGKLGIESAHAIIDIYTSLNEKIMTLETDKQQIKPGKRAELSVKADTKLNPGSYLAKVTVLYDGETSNLDKQFSIGSQDVGIERIAVNGFKLGDIAKLEILVENKWNEDMKGVYANLLVYDNNNEVMADVKSSSEDIASMSKKQLLAFWDTAGVDEGEYNGKLMVKYGQKSSDKNLVLKVSESNLDIVGVGYAIKPKGGGGIDLTTIVMILVILVVVLLLLNVVWFVYFKKLLKKK